MKALTCITKALKKQLHTYELVHSHKCIAHWFWLHLFWPLEDRVLQCLWVTALSTGRIVIGMIYVGNRSTITTSLSSLSPINPIPSNSTWGWKKKLLMPSLNCRNVRHISLLEQRTKLDNVLHHGCLLCKVSLLFYRIGIGISLDAVTVPI